MQLNPGDAGRVALALKPHLALDHLGQRIERVVALNALEQDALRLVISRVPVNLLIDAPLRTILQVCYDLHGEGLPTTFVEAAAHRCAILSFTDPDGFATRFGRQAREGQLEEGLRELLRENRWKALGEQARQYVEQVFSIENAMDAHDRAYDAAIREKRRGRAGA